MHGTRVSKFICLMKSTILIKSSKDKTYNKAYSVYNTIIYVDAITK